MSNTNRLRHRKLGLCRGEIQSWTLLRHHAIFALITVSAFFCAFFNPSNSRLFTHVDDLSEAWLLELRRIFSSKGRLYLTIHDNQTIELLQTNFQNIFLSKKLRSSELYSQAKDGMAVLTLGRDRGSQVFYDIDYFCKKLSMMYKIHSVTNEAYNYQTAILVCRK